MYVQYQSRQSKFCQIEILSKLLDVTKNFKKNGIIKSRKHEKFITTMLLALLDNYCEK